MSADAGVQSGERFIPQAQLLDNAARAATGLSRLGLGADDGVGIMLRNDVPFFEATYAAQTIGAYPVPINWHFKADEAGYILADSGAKAVVIHADLLPQVAGGIPDGVRILVVETPPELASAYGLAPDRTAVPEGRTSWQDFVAGHEPWTDPPRAGRASMIYTSGTTGRPKGVRRLPDATGTRPAQPPAATGRPAAAADARNVGTVLGVVPGVRSIIPAPMYHSAPNAYSLIAIRLGGFLVLQPRFEPEEFLRLVERFGVTHVQVVPTMLVRLLRLDEEVRKRYDLSSLEHIVHAAAPCPPEVKRQAIEWLGPIVWEYYGCTESGISTAVSSEEWLEAPGTVGTPMPGADVRILDSEGRVLGPGEVGDIYVTAPGIGNFTYQGNDEARRAMEREGFITCGDMGYLDGAKRLFISDRRNDMVISGGVNIYPAEIESTIITIPGVRDCAVFGIPDEEFGEALCAVIEIEPGSGVTSDDVRVYLKSRLAGYKSPRVVEFRDDLPREDSGKIFKRRLREPYWKDAGRTI